MFMDAEAAITDATNTLMYIDSMLKKLEDAKNHKSFDQSLAAQWTEALRSERARVRANLNQIVSEVVQEVEASAGICSDDR